MASGYQYTGQRELNEDFWNSVSTDAPAPLEDGVYEVECVKADPRPTRKDGKPSINCTFKVLGAWGNDEELNQTVFDTFTFEQAGAFKVKNFCEATNVDLPASTYNDEMDRLAGDMTGVTVWADLGTREYNGKKNNNVIRYIADGEVDDYIEQQKAGERGTGEAPKKKKRSERAGAEKTGAQEREEAGARVQQRRARQQSNGQAAAAPAAAQTEDLDDDDGNEAAAQEEENPRRRVARRRRAES